MAVNESRNLSNELREGLTDGSVKKIAPDRGGVTEPDNHTIGVLQEQYGVQGTDTAHEAMASRLHLPL